MFDGVIKQDAIRQPEDETIRQNFRRDRIGMSRLNKILI